MISGTAVLRAEEPEGETPDDSVRIAGEASTDKAPAEKALHVGGKDVQPAASSTSTSSGQKEIKWVPIPVRLEDLPPGTPVPPSCFNGQGFNDFMANGGGGPNAGPTGEMPGMGSHAH